MTKKVRGKSDKFDDRLTTITKQRDDLVNAVETLISCEEHESDDCLMSVMAALSTIKRDKNAQSK